MTHYFKVNSVSLDDEVTIKVTDFNVSKERHLFNLTQTKAVSYQLLLN